MPLYKVEFENNIAVSGKVISKSLLPEPVKFSRAGDKTTIKWYVIDAETESQAIEFADRIVRQIWGDILK
jgi:hypothetical protein